MPRIYRLSRTGTRLLYKIRHHKGHGIHSPFVFGFITRVIEERTPYYAYDDIRTYLENFPDILFSESKINRLSFKTVNYFNPKNILELGSGSGFNTLYITAAASDINCMCVELERDKYKQAQILYKQWRRNILLSEEKFPVLKEKQDGIFINLRNYDADSSQLISYLLSIVKENSFIFIDGIRTNRKQQMLWKQLIHLDEVIISMDLFHLGILFFDKKFFKRNYKLSF